MHNEIPDINRIFEISSGEDFKRLALQIFRYQYRHTEVYRDFVDYLRISPAAVDDFRKIPFMPIEFFKSHKILHKQKTAQKIFRSSGTSGMDSSRHYVADLNLYRKSFLRAFQHFYGNPENYCFLALLPSYLERQDASLVYMLHELIQVSRFSQSGFFLSHEGELAHILQSIQTRKIPCILIGVSFALLDFAEKFPLDLSGITVMETGGMKGRRKEMIKEELHSILKQGFNVPDIHSEYGMTELLSQAYSQGDNIFRSPPWMKILIRDPNDPLQLTTASRQGGINVIDLANIYSCSFIATQDIGRSLPGGAFEVLGRFDHSDIRGCNLLLL